MFTMDPPPTKTEEVVVTVFCVLFFIVWGVCVVLAVLEHG